MAHHLRAPLIVFGLLVALARPAVADKVPAAAPPDDESAGAAQPAAAPPADLGEELPTTRPADLAYGVAARLVWVSVPSWLLNAFTKQNVPLSSWGTGLSVFRRKGNFDIALSFNYQNMSPPDGNWLGSSNNPATDTSFLQFRSFALYGFDFSFLWHNYFTNWFGISLRRGRRDWNPRRIHRAHEGAGPELHGPERGRPQPVHAQRPRQPNERRPSGQRAAGGADLQRPARRGLSRPRDPRLGGADRGRVLRRVLPGRRRRVHVLAGYGSSPGPGPPRPETS